MPTDWISSAEAAELSGYHPEHIRRLARQDQFTVTKKGMMFWIDRDSFVAFLRKTKKAKEKDKRRGPKSKES
jgi:hypothetical protein